MDILPHGLYENLHTEELHETLRDTAQLDLAVWKRCEINELIRYVSIEFSRKFTEYLNRYLDVGKHARNSTMHDSLAAMHRDGIMTDILNMLHPVKDELLHEIRQFSHTSPSPRPDTPLAFSALFTGTARTPSLISQLQKEFESCDQAEWLVSFIKLSGLNPLMPALRRFTAVPLPGGESRLKVATTSYMGATDIKAVERLMDLDNTDIRLSLDTKRTRLHAKAFIFHRHSGYGTAYIGSANISRSALNEGLEWTAKVSQSETPHLWEHVVAAFTSHWEDESEFIPNSDTAFSQFKASLKNERALDTRNASVVPLFNPTPYLFQQVILDDIAAERAAGKNRHLIISATGTGKTMVAAFDYERFAGQAGGGWPTLLYIAHREELLEQALISFRQVLGDSGDFGELLTGNHDPREYTHLFCTVQSWNSRRLSEFPTDHFAYVVLDEAHHGPAASYQRLIRHVEPQSLLGLTATPERADGRNVRDDFDGLYTHELRLAEAVERALLVPFHYYGVPDLQGIDLSTVSWKLGRYDPDGLNALFAENTGRANWVLREVDRYIADTAMMRGLGFCVSKCHAEFMASRFSAAGIPAQALTSDSGRILRKSVIRQLRLRSINIIFTVDLFNEGVDIPFADTLLFLRPTESLTVFLQQLGRGLRLHKGKTHVTVLDFVAPQGREFDFVSRFRNLSMHPGDRMDRQIDAGMPFVPTGCFIHLEKKVREIVLDNITASTNRLRGKKFIQEFREMVSRLGDGITMDDMLDWFHISSPDAIYQNGLPSDLIAAEGKHGRWYGKPTEKSFDIKTGLRKLLLLDDTFLVHAFYRYLAKQDPADQRLLNVFHATLWKRENRKRTSRPGDGTIADVDAYLRNHPGLRRDLLDLFDWLLRETPPANSKRFPKTGELRLHAAYSRDQIFTMLGLGTFEKPKMSREGIYHHAGMKCDLFFVDINKEESDFSPTTMYEDYAVTDSRFHWQSQSTTSESSETGQRYIHHRERNYTPFLFFREHKRLANGLTTPYFFAGPLRYLRHVGSKPMSILWELEVPLPTRVLKWARRVG